MCAKCKKPELMIGLQTEAWAMKGCFKLWQKWCAQNAEETEGIVVDYLNRNSHSLRIMGLFALIPHRGAPNNLRRPYRPKRAPQTKKNRASDV